MRGELNDTQIRNVLTSQVLGRLAYTEDKQPYIVPVTYSYDGEYIYGQTNEGTKLKALRKNPNVSFEVDMMTDMTNWQSVVVLGTFEALKQDEAEHAREVLFNNVFSLMTTSKVHSHEHAATAKVDDSNRVKLVVYRIKIKSISGRYEKV